MDEMNRLVNVISQPVAHYGGQEVEGLYFYFGEIIQYCETLQNVVCLAAECRLLGRRC